MGLLSNHAVNHQEPAAVVERVNGLMIAPIDVCAGVLIIVMPDFTRVQCKLVSAAVELSQRLSDRSGDRCADAETFRNCGFARVFFGASEPCRVQIEEG
jgi:hypothetical protein